MIQVIHRQSAYLVETDPQNPNHHGLHTNRSPYVLTFHPGNGDKIAYVLSGRTATFLDGENVNTGDGGIASLEIGTTLRPSQVGDGFDENVILKVKAYLRSAGLGEDGLEDREANGLAVLWIEHLNGAEWNYAPIEVEIEKLPDSHTEEQASAFFMRQLTPLKATQCGHVWTIAE